MMKFFSKLLIGGLCLVMLLMGLQTWWHPSALAHNQPAFSMLTTPEAELLSPSSTVTVTVAPSGALTFTPSLKYVVLGDTVDWVWDSSFHSTTSGTCSGPTCTPDGKWDSGVHNVPFTFPMTFTSTGAFPYYCSVHGPLGMQGTIVVLRPRLYLPLILKQ